MKTLKDLPEKTSDDVQNKIRCFLDENRQLNIYIVTCQARIRNNNNSINELIARSAKSIRDKHKIKSIDFLEPL